METLREVPLDITFLLRTRQTRLINYQVHDAGDTQIADLLPRAEELCRITSVQLYVTDASDCKTVPLIFERAHNIRSLSITAWRNLDFGEATHSENCEKLINCIFSSVTSGTAHPLQLHHLHLMRLDLERCGGVLVEIIDLSRLKKVALESCRNSSTLFTHLAESDNMLKDVIDIDEEEDEDLDRDGYKQFLTCAKGLRTIRSTAFPITERDPNATRCSWDLLQHHGTTLRILELDHVDHNSDVFDLEGCEAFSRLMKRCTVMEQLAFTMPKAKEAFDMILVSDECRMTLEARGPR